MAMRLSGLMSGMDTETIIQQLVEARSTKVKTAKNDKTKLEWKQEAWKGLNSKLKTLQSKINNLRFASDYTKKMTKSSDEKAVSVITGETAVNGVQELKIEQLAKTAYMTGGKVALREGVQTALNSETGMNSLLDFGTDAEKTLTLKTGSGDAEKETQIQIKADTTISDVLNQLRDAGLNANFDQTQKRFYISARESGSAGKFELAGGTDVLAALGLGRANTTYVDGQDAKISLNGVEYTNTSNTFEINGLTITAHSIPTDTETITLTTQQDTDGIYNKIKDFLKSYNEVMNEIDKLYNAEAAKGFEPLTDEEKEKMSETEIEKYEQKIKDALLRRDSGLNAIATELRKKMMSAFYVEGKGNVSLASFGVETLGYWKAKENERNAYHILGDPDDSDVADKEDKLKGLIASNPDSVISFFSQLSKALYSKMDDLSAPIEGYRSYGSFYDDKKLKADFDDYKKKIADLEKKLAAYEDKWYAKFADMETTMAKMQQGASAVTGLLGGGN